MPASVQHAIFGYGSQPGLLGVIWQPGFHKKMFSSECHLVHAVSACVQNKLDVDQGVERRYKPPVCPVTLLCFRSENSYNTIHWPVHRFISDKIRRFVQNDPRLVAGKLVYESAL